MSHGAGRAAAALYARLAPRLFLDLEEAGLIPAGDADRARREWECFALYACVRGVVAGRGFGADAAAAVDALHEAALPPASAETHAGEAVEALRRRVAERYAEYGEIGRAGGKSGAATVTGRLGLAAARHMTGVADPAEPLVEMVGALHESLAEAVADAVKREED